jgi:hypothetical protein
VEKRKNVAPAGIRTPIIHSIARRYTELSRLARKFQFYKKKKGKATPVTGRAGLEGCEMLRIPHCLEYWLIDGSEVIRLTSRQRFTPSRRFLVLISVTS